MKELTRRELFGLAMSAVGLTSSAGGTIKSEADIPNPPKRDPDDNSHPIITKDEFKHMTRVLKGSNWISRSFIWGGALVFGTGLGIADGKPHSKKIKNQ